MSFTIKFKLVEDKLPELEKRLKDLDGHKVGIGMWKEQGVHKPSGFPAVSLFRYLSEGNPAKNLPPRSPLQTVAALVPLSSSPLKPDITKYLSNITGRPPITPLKVMGDLGEFYRDKVRDVFGDAGLLAPKAASTKSKSKSPNTPLIETKELASKVAYKIDNDIPKEVGR